MDGKECKYGALLCEMIKINQNDILKSFQVLR